LQQRTSFTSSSDLAAGRPDPVSYGSSGGGLWMGSVGQWMGSSGQSIDFFSFFYLINPGGCKNRLG
jgi:hypothetical protein